MTTPEREFNPGAAVLAWLWPGLGHMSLGEKKRGGLIMFGVLFLIMVGVLVGGIESVDRQDDRLWFLAQMFCGPLAFGLDWLTQNLLRALPEDEQLRAIGVGRANEMGTLFIALAGLMNLVVMIDALSHVPRSEVTRTSGRRKEDGGA